MRFWNNLHQICSKSNIWKANKLNRKSNSTKVIYGWWRRIIVSCYHGVWFYYLNKIYAKTSHIFRKIHNLPYVIVLLGIYRNFREKTKLRYSMCGNPDMLYTKQDQFMLIRISFFTLLAIFIYHRLCVVDWSIEPSSYYFTLSRLIWMSTCCRLVYYILIHLNGILMYWLWNRPVYNKWTFILEGTM
jgi:hypothetical protein